MPYYPGSDKGTNSMIHRFDRYKAGLMVLCCCVVVACGGDDGVSPENIPPPSMSDLFGDVLYTADGDEVGIDAVESKSIIGIYFQSPSCMACGQFTPILIDFYEELGLDGKSFEVVLVSFADSQEDMLANMHESGMPWLAVPTGGIKAQGMTDLYDIQFVPTLIVIDNGGRTITMDGVADVFNRGVAAYDVWSANSGG
jgi:nucleoredoxin